MADNAKPRILYVEDEHLIRELGVESHDEAGFDVDACPTAQQAKTAIDAEGAAFRALVTDIDLGSELSGWDVARYAREAYPGLPIVYVSGGSSNDWPAMGVPGSIMLLKPYAAAQLIVALSTAILPADGRPPT